MIRAAAALVAALACVGADAEERTPPAKLQVGTSVGQPWSGRLDTGIAMPTEGRHHRFTSTTKKRGANFGSQALVALLLRAAGTVDHYVQSPPLVLGDLSRCGGGKLGGHKSHQAGRDVDILFYVEDTQTQVRRAAVGFYDFDAEGRCTKPACRRLRFALRENWWLVRTMLWSKRPFVQYIFVADWLKARLLAYAEKRGEHPEILRRARKVLAQPRNSSPHADHFHVRIYCTPEERARGCSDGGPRWDWVK